MGADSTSRRSDPRGICRRSGSAIWERGLIDRVDRLDRCCGGRLCSGVALVDSDVEAALQELLFDVELAGLLKRKERGPHPADFVAGHVGLRDVDGGSSQVGAGDVALGGGSIAVCPLKLLLVVHGADGRADLKRALKTGCVEAGEVGEELRGPRAAEAVRLWEILVDGKVGRGWNWYQKVVGDAVLQVVLILNALQAVLSFGLFVLALERRKGATQRRRKTKIAAVQRDNLGGGCERLRQLEVPIAQAGSWAAAGEDGGAGLGSAAAKTDASRTNAC